MREPTSDAHAEQRMRDAERSGDRFPGYPQAVASNGSMPKGRLLDPPVLPGAVPRRPRTTKQAILNAEDYLAAHEADYPEDD